MVALQNPWSNGSGEVFLSMGIKESEKIWTEIDFCEPKMHVCFNFDQNLNTSVNQNAVDNPSHLDLAFSVVYSTKTQRKPTSQVPAPVGNDYVARNQ